MKTKFSGILSMEVQMQLPLNCCIPKEAKCSIKRLKRNLISISMRRKGEDLSQLESIISVLNLTVENNCIATKIIQHKNTLCLCLRFSTHTDANSFIRESGNKIKITGLGFKFLTKAPHILSTPNKDELYRMTKILESIDKAFFDTAECNNGNITKCYVYDNYTIATWVLFSKKENAQKFLLTISENNSKKN